MPPRTIEDLKIVLERQGADLERVVFCDDFQDRDDVVCIRHYLDGWRPPPVDIWETFYWERGKNERRTFETEAEACAYFLSWVETLPWAWRKVSS
jgi:hypothetical protein